MRLACRIVLDAQACDLRIPILIFKGAVTSAELQRLEINILRRIYLSHHLLLDICVFHLRAQAACGCKTIERLGLRLLP